MATDLQLTAPPAADVPAPGLARWARWVLVANLVAEIGIVVTGGLVRLTGSGLGCPTWPQCVPGSYTPVVQQPQGVHKYIEFGNRTLTSVVRLLALAALVAVLLDVRRRARPRRAGARRRPARRRGRAGGPRRDHGAHPPEARRRWPRTSWCRR